MSILTDLTKAIIQRNVPFLLLLLIVGFMGTGCGGGNNAGNGASASTDTNPPSIPEGLDAQAVSSMQIDLSWLASTDDTGVTGYNIYRCTGSSCTPTVLLSTVNSPLTTYSDTGLTAETTYTYTYAVMTYDAVPNISNQTSSVSATTNATTSGGDPTIFSVSGISGDGGNVVIGGSGFGVNNLDIHWLGGADGVIEMTNIGELPSNLYGWQYFNWNDDASVTGSQAHSGLKSFEIPMTSSGYYAGLIRYGHDSRIGFNQDIFISWWTRRIHVGDGQWKIFRTSYQNSILDTSTPQFKSFDWYHSNQLFVASGPSTNATDYTYNAHFPSQDNRWYRVDINVHTASGHGVNDGKLTWSLHDPIENLIVHDEIIADVTTFNDDNDYYQWFLWQNYIGNGIISSTVWIDDPYIQVGTQARVEIADTATWDTNTHREIQIPGSWDSNSINITVNQGSFNSGDTAYLFVIDENGVASNGYPIQFGN